MFNDRDYPLLASYEFAGERVRKPPEPDSDRRSPSPSYAIRPRVGIALAGGGTRAAAFAMGVLRGLYEDGILQKADIVSTVSGGSYTGYFYFTKLLDEYYRRLGNSERGVSDIFADCLPSRYAKLCDGLDGKDGDECAHPGLDGKLKVCETAAHTAKHGDPYRFQGHVRGFVNPLSSSPTFVHDPSPTISTIGFAAGWVSEGVVKAPVLAVTNILFDWRLASSSTRDDYRTGLARTYGSLPAPCNSTDCQDRRPLPPRAAPYSLCTLRELWRNDYELPCPTNDKSTMTCRVPLWIINTTADYGFWVKGVDFAGKDDLELTTFEITPLGYRSRLYGDHRGLRPTSFCLDNGAPAPRNNQDDGFWREIPMDEAVAASAAFLDDQQRDFRGLRVLQAGVSTLFGANWGYEIPNEHVSTTRVATTHALLPLPLYLVHRYERDEHAVSIHLGDGGQAENLGLWPLLRREVRNIVVVDSGWDRNGTLYDLCRVAKALTERGLELRFPGLDGFSSNEKLCKASLDELERIGGHRGEAQGYDVYHWKAPVVAGCVLLSGDESGKCPARPGDPGWEKLWSRIFLIKPAIDLSDSSPLAEALKACRDVLGASAASDAQRQACSEAIENPSPPLPLELIGYLETPPGNSLEKDGFPTFPQDTTTSMTVDSNSDMFGAYRELGRWYARHLEWNDHEIQLRGGEFPPQTPVDLRPGGTSSSDSSLAS